MSLEPIILNSIIRKIIDEQHTFILDGQLAEVVKEKPFCQILIRCGNGRFVCAAQYAQHFIDIITRERTDYVRDVSIAS